MGGGKNGEKIHYLMRNFGDGMKGCILLIACLCFVLKKKHPFPRSG